MLVEETLVVPAKPEELAAVHAAVERFWHAVDGALAQPPDHECRMRFAIAVVEIATNIIRHAYPTGTQSGAMQLCLRAYADRAVACFTDQGVAFPGSLEAGSVPDLDASELPEGGYGLALARASLDRLDYSRTPDGQNRWRLLKQFIPDR